MKMLDIAAFNAEEATNLFRPNQDARLRLQAQCRTLMKLWDGIGVTLLHFHFVLQYFVFFHQCHFFARKTLE